MIPRVTLGLVLAAILGTCPAAEASILSHTDTIVEISPPPDARTGHLESDKRIRAFPEQQHISLTKDIAVDITLPGTSPSGGVPSLTPGVVATGTIINSYFLHFDDVGTPADPVHIVGSITFSDNVLGIAVLEQFLDASDAYPGLPTTIYAFNDAARGLEVDGGAGFDSITLSADRRTISLDLHNVNKSDDLRIITASAVPEPSTVWLLAAGISVLLGHRLMAKHRARIGNDLVTGLPIPPQRRYNTGGGSF